MKGNTEMYISYTHLFLTLIPHYVVTPLQCLPSDQTPPSMCAVIQTINICDTYDTCIQKKLFKKKLPSKCKSYIRTYVRTYVHTYVHTYIRTYLNYKLGIGIFEKQTCCPGLNHH